MLLCRGCAYVRSHTLWYATLYAPVRIPVHLSVPLCANMPVFADTLPVVWTGIDVLTGLNDVRSRVGRVQLVDTQSTRTGL